jgi:sigma-B regulation protein RsbU (phosphoserine phosphatase)
MLVAIGDVTGHGVSSALVTAAAHGAFSVLLRRYERAHSSSGKKPDIGELMFELNEAVRAAGGEDVAMTMLLSLIDTRSGEMVMCNASHRPPYVYRPDRANGEHPKGLESFQIVSGAKIAQLGLAKDIVIETSTFQLSPGDLIVWYTDGLVECENEEGKPLRKTDLLRLIANLRESQRSVNSTADSGAHTLCTGLMDEFKNFLGARVANPDDDTTIAVALISEDAQFLRKAA